MRLKALLLLLAPLLFYACGSSKKTQKSVMLDEVMVMPKPEYRPSATRVNDLLHTVLRVAFDWEKQRLNGSATLTLKPYVKPVSELVLDAKGFDILKVGKMQGASFTELPFQYDSLLLTIDLQKSYSEKDTYQIFIEYVAKPNELPEGGSHAISSDKGLYFINPLGAEKNKPMQVWTQGETEASSCWFPTIDKPNERTTQEIYITVADTLVTLSNGLLISSTKNADGTRTDYWKMDQPHAPYLFMMAVGDFAVVRDKWRGIAVDYYVEKEYEPHAMKIFGNTPEMLEFYSQLFGVDYPWQKYAQVCVRDFVSGAMENTTATIHFENMQLTQRELIDFDYEDIIAHELIHQWFGDYVTCESWSNLTLNEGFATYGEYLWVEYKYGIDMAERHRMSDMQNYLYESSRFKRPIVDFHFRDKEDMFDSHSYAKGGLVLHMLRKYLGDDVFFRASTIYLKEHAFRAVEVHHLRLAFEEASGEDLNWFFNQWLLSPGHPRLDIGHHFNAEKSIAKVTVRQTQDEPPFRLHAAIEIYAPDEYRREHVTLDQREQTFEFAVSGKPLLVMVDADKNLLCERTESKPAREWAHQYEVAQGFMNKREALMNLAPMQEKDTLAKNTIAKAMNDPFWALRKLAVEKIITDDATKPLLVNSAEYDQKPHVRAAALERLGETKSEIYLSIYQNALADSSLQVIANALEAIVGMNEDEALKLAPQFEEFNTTSIVSTLGEIYAAKGGDDKQDYFENKAYVAGSWARFGLLSDYGTYLKSKKESIIKKGLVTLEDIALNANSMWDRYAAASAIHEIKVAMGDKSANGQLTAEHKKALNEELAALLEKIIAAEKNDKLKAQYKNF